MKGFVKDFIKVVNPSDEAHDKQETAPKAEKNNVQDKLHDFKLKRGLSETKEESASNSNQLSSAIVKEATVRCRLVEPQDERDAFFVADLIEDKKIVLIKLENLEHETALKILHTIYGAAYSQKVDPKKIGAKLILIDPTKPEDLR